jgi:hypothetical protein
MSDRLTDLRRQRAAIQQHLDWLDREITAAQPGPAQAPTPVKPAPTAAPVASTVSAPDPTLPDLGQPDPVNAARQAKKGCLLYLVVALVVFFATIFVIFHFAYGDRPWLFMDRGQAASEAGP